MPLGLTQHPWLGHQQHIKKKGSCWADRSWGNVGGPTEVQMPPTHAEPSGGKQECFGFTLQLSSHSCAKLLLGKNVNPNMSRRPGRMKESEGPLWGPPGKGFLKAQLHIHVD